MSSMSSRKGAHPPGLQACPTEWAGPTTGQAGREPVAADGAGAPEPRVEHLLTAIETRFSEPDLSLAKLAREHNLSTWHLCHLIRAHSAQGFRRRLHENRCARAWQMLRGTSLSVKEVAVAVGYNETRSLDRQFKRQYGCVPSDVRRRSPVRRNI